MNTTDKSSDETRRQLWAKQVLERWEHDLSTTVSDKFMGFFKRRTNIEHVTPPQSARHNTATRLDNDEKVTIGEKRVAWEEREALRIVVAGLQSHYRDLMVRLAEIQRRQRARDRACVDRAAEDAKRRALIAESRELQSQVEALKKSDATDNRIAASNEALESVMKRIEEAKVELMAATSQRSKKEAEVERLRIELRAVQEGGTDEDESNRTLNTYRMQLATLSQELSKQRARTESAELSLADRAAAHSAEIRFSQHKLLDLQTERKHLDALIQEVQKQQSPPSQQVGEASSSSSSQPLPPSAPAAPSSSIRLSKRVFAAPRKVFLKGMRFFHHHDDGHQSSSDAGSSQQHHQDPEGATHSSHHDNAADRAIQVKEEQRLRALLANLKTEEQWLMNERGEMRQQLERSNSERRHRRSLSEELQQQHSSSSATVTASNSTTSSSLPSLRRMMMQQPPRDAYDASGAGSRFLHPHATSSRSAV